MEELCRACMTCSVALVHIFDDQREPSLPDMLNECVACDIKLEDELPQKICVACISDLQTAFGFKRKCENSNRLLSAKLLQSMAEDFLCPVKKEPEEHLMSSEETVPETQTEFHINEECQDGCKPSSSSSIKNDLSPITGSPNRSPVGSKHIVKVQSELLETENWELAETEIDLGSVKVEKDEEVSEKQQIELSSNLPEEDNTCTSPGSIDTKKNRFICPHCTKNFSQSSHLNAHIRTHTGERPFKCPQCPKAFSQVSNLRKHICIHSGERPFKCPHCARAFTRHTDLQYHVSTHPGQKIYKCPHCTRYFIEQTELDEHMRYHNGERTYKCTECSREYTFPWQLQRHIRTHTGEHPFKCPHCPKICVDKGDLGRHVRSHTAAYLNAHISTHPS